MVAGGCGGGRCIAMHDHEDSDEIGDVRSRSPLCDPALMQAFMTWWVEEPCRKLTPGLRHMVMNLEVVARHWLKDLPYAEALKELLKGDLAVVDAATRCPPSTPHASMTFERPGPSSATTATRQSHGGERLVAWANRSDAGADVLAPGSIGPSVQPIRCRSSRGGTAAQRSIAWHAATRGPL
jgi:hypothetical protein